MIMAVKFKLDTKAFGAEVLNAEYMVNVVNEYAQGVLNRAGGAAAGYAMASKQGRKRALAMVYTDTIEAMADDANNHTLLKAMNND